MSDIRAFVAKHVPEIGPWQLDVIERLAEARREGCDLVALAPQRLGRVRGLASMPVILDEAVEFIERQEAPDEVRE